MNGRIRFKRCNLRNDGRRRRMKVKQIAQKGIGRKERASRLRFVRRVCPVECRIPVDNDDRKMRKTKTKKKKSRQHTGTDNKLPTEQYLYGLTRDRSDQKLISPGFALGIINGEKVDCSLANTYFLPPVFVPRSLFLPPVLRDLQSFVCLRHRGKIRLSQLDFFLRELLTFSSSRWQEIRSRSKRVTMFKNVNVSSTNWTEIIDFISVLRFCYFFFSFIFISKEYKIFGRLTGIFE